MLALTFLSATSITPTYAQTITTEQQTCVDKFLNGVLGLASQSGMQLSQEQINEAKVYLTTYCLVRYPANGNVTPGATQTPGGLVVGGQTSPTPGTTMTPAPTSQAVNNARTCNLPQNGWSKGDRGPADNQKWGDEGCLSIAQLTVKGKPKEKTNSVVLAGGLDLQITPQGNDIWGGTTWHLNADLGDSYGSGTILQRFMQMTDEVEKRDSLQKVPLWVVKSPNDITDVRNTGKTWPAEWKVIQLNGNVSTYQDKNPGGIDNYVVNTDDLPLGDTQLFTVFTAKSGLTGKVYTVVIYPNTTVVRVPNAWTGQRQQLAQEQQWPSDAIIIKSPTDLPTELISQGWKAQKIF
jgi:hypothetical protein